MKRFTWLALLLTLLLPLVGCMDERPLISMIDWVDFIKFNDIMYHRETQSVSVNESNLSPYDEIKFKIADNVNNPAYKSKNGDAAYLEKGTQVYSITGYSPYFRLVVKENQKLLIYEADTNPKAKKGSDLLDIGDKVEYIGINSKIDGTTELASIKGQARVNELVQMILDAPVDQDSHKTGSEQYFLEFHFKDGTTTKRSYWLDTGIITRGIQTPEEFGEIIRSALNGGY
jgi:hypothetical protein